MRRIINKLLHSSIKHKLIVLAMFVSGVAIFLLSSAFILNDVRDAKHSMVQEIALLNKVIGSRAISRLAFDQESKAEKDLYDLYQIPSIRLACLYKNNGELFALYLKKGESLSCPKKPLQFGYWFNWSSLVIYQKVFSLGGQADGAMYIESDLNEIYSHLAIYAVTTSIVIILVIIIAYFLTVRLQAVISTPILSLVGSMQSIREVRDYSARAKILYNDELGLLANSFNEMLSEIERRDQFLEQKVQERTEDLEYALKVKEDFLSNMSHEIRTPIHGVISFVRLLVEEWNTSDDDILFNYAQRAHKSSDRLLALINNLLDMSKFEKGAVQLERKELLFSDLIQTVIAETSGVVEAKHEKLVFQPMANEPLVEVDEGRMAQVMTNLIGNAVKYSEKGTIRISQSVNPEAIFLDGVAQAPGMIISISDEGIGIPEDELVKIFDKFFESSLTKTKAGGTGLGLAISREIVKAHLGTIWAENNKNGIGSTFTFMFPLKEIPGVTQITEKYV
ncbi:MAG: HAMP domain-containing histidine kinase [Alphaproteobacteria bacterium]|nr:HAMP domain-containing histidine kinase [Alphaproteobacteria bacterium]